MTDVLTSFEDSMVRCYNVNRDSSLGMTEFLRGYMFALMDAYLTDTPEYDDVKLLLNMELFYK